MSLLNPLFTRTTQPPRSNVNDKAAVYAIIANNFHASSWLLAAASLQGFFTWLFPSVLSFLPALVVIGYRTLHMVLMMYGILPNRNLDDVVLGKMSAQLPDETGDFGNKVSHGTVVVMILASRSNHPLGILYPQYQNIIRYFNKMHEDAEKNRREYKYLTSTAWISLSDSKRTAAREIMHIFYFQSMEGLNKIAHATAHRAGWDWWNRTAKEHPELSVMHALYEVPARNWENIYLNYLPAGFGSSMFPVKKAGSASYEKVKDDLDESSNKFEWISNLVDASKIQLKTREKRMGRA